jgi:hypothetical protein
MDPCLGIIDLNRKYRHLCDLFKRNTGAFLISPFAGFDNLFLKV